MPKHSEWREETGPHGAKRWVNLRTGRIQYRDPGTPHPTFARAQAEQKKKQSTDNSQGALGQHEEPNKAEVVDSAKLDQLIKTNKTPELFRGVPKMEHAEQFKTGDLRQGNGAYGPGIYVGYGYNGRETASKAAGDDGHMARMTLRPDAKVMTWDEAETTWEKEGKAEFSLDKYGGSEKAIAAFAKSKGVDVLDVQHNEFMNVLNPKALIVEKPKGTGEGGGNPPDDKPPEPPAPEKKLKKKSKAKLFQKDILADGENISVAGIDPDDIPTLVGAPDDAIVRITNVPRKGAEGKKQWSVNIKSKNFDSDMDFGVDERGRKFLHIDGFWVNDKAQGAGLGSEIFANAVDATKDSGFDYVKLHAAQYNPQDPDKPHNGYYTWPRFGFDADIDDLKRGVQTQIRDKFPKADTILDVMSSKEGRDWWKANGSDLNETRFDLKEDSRSMRIFGAYMEERAKRQPAASDGPKTYAKEQAAKFATMDLAAWEEEALDAAWEKLFASEDDHGKGNNQKSDSKSPRPDKRSEGASGTGGASNAAPARTDRSDKPADAGDKPTDRGSGQVGTDGTNGSLGDSVSESGLKPSEDLTEEQKAEAKKKPKLAWNDVRNPQILNYLPPNG